MPEKCSAEVRKLVESQNITLAAKVLQYIFQPHYTLPTTTTAPPETTIPAKILSNSVQFEILSPTNANISAIDIDDEDPALLRNNRSFFLDFNGVDFNESPNPPGFEFYETTQPFFFDLDETPQTPGVDSTLFPFEVTSENPAPVGPPGISPPGGYVTNDYMPSPTLGKVWSRVLDLDLALALAVALDLAPVPGLTLRPNPNATPTPYPHPQRPTP